MTGNRPHVELNLSFPDKDHVLVTLGATGTGNLRFVSPITKADRRDLRWYVETYGAQSLGDPDDVEARRIAGLLPEWGRRLFDAAFGESVALRLFHRFQDTRDRDRVLTIAAEHPAILALPWELLHDSAPNGGFLFHDNPRISIRRTVAGATDGVAPFPIAPKERLRLLFVVSRPEGAGFLDPRADPQAVLDALEEHAPGRVSCEFLRPPTLDMLVERLEDETRPVDVVHFDGHGVFDREGGLPETIEQNLAGRRHGAEIMRDREPGPDAGPPDTGYLLFESATGEIDPVSADKLGRNLHQHRVALVILSACQSAAMAELDSAKADDDEVERPMGSVAARLTATGIPSVLAMTHSVLVPTTRALFGALYKDLARQKRLGEALDNARRFLSNHPEKYEVQRGPERTWLRLQDWFLPALYQAGEDAPLLAEPPAGDPLAAAPPRTNLRAAPEEGFFGRRRELWQIERWFTAKARRITITGFGGQGKTALAEEAGRWLVRTRMFEATVFVDYSRIQALDAEAVAVTNIGTVLGTTLLDAGAATAALRKVPTLIVLDNLEALAPEPLRALLDAAVAWSEAGSSRVMCTTRRPELGHPQYRIDGTLVHRRIPLAGLGDRRNPDDALEWFAELSKLPPAPTAGRPRRADLIDLFEKVRFHPLSIRVLAQQLKTREAKRLGERLEELLAPGAASADGAAIGEDTPAGLLASLQLSLDRLDPAARALLPRLGVFQGGAFEDDLLAIVQIPEAEWRPLCRQLEAAALLEVENVDGVGPPFLRFHPTLAPMLWAGLNAEEQEGLGIAHRQRYSSLAHFLYTEDNRNPLAVRAIARREMPNLLHAVHAELDASEPDAVNVADSVNKFLVLFGLQKEASLLLAKAQAATGDPGSEAWLIAQSNRGEQLYRAGNMAEAAEIFAGILRSLGESQAHVRAVTMARLARCYRSEGKESQAIHLSRETLSILDSLEPSATVKRSRSAALSDLADALRSQGEFVEARNAYEASLRLDIELNDVRSQGVTLGQLGTLAMVQGQLEEAVKHHRDALELFQQLGERDTEAVYWHQLGMDFQMLRRWDEAERHYREAARLKEEEGNLAGVAGAAGTWTQLATVSRMAGKPDSADGWYRKAIEAFRRGNNLKELSKALNNLASLLASQSGRRREAWSLAEESLRIKRALDPGAAEIWTTYWILADLAEQEAAEAADELARARLQMEAREHRRLARETKLNFAGTRYELRRHAGTILGTVVATQDPARRVAFERELPGLVLNGWKSLVAAIRRILAGEREKDSLCDGLDLEDSTIVAAILQGIEDPSSLQDLMPEPEPTPSE